MRSRMVTPDEIQLCGLPPLRRGWLRNDQAPWAGPLPALGVLDVLSAGASLFLVDWIDPPEQPAHRIDRATREANLARALQEIDEAIARQPERGDLTTDRLARLRADIYAAFRFVTARKGRGPQ